MGIDAVDEVDFDVSRPHDSAFDGHPNPTAVARAEAGEQFVHVERLGDVVVGAEIERRHLLHVLVTGGDHQQGRVSCASSQRVTKGMAGVAQRFL